MNFYNHHNSVSFKSHSISVTFKFCAVLVALCALEPCSTDSLGTQHCAKFESNTNRMTFEYAPNMMIVKVHPQYKIDFGNSDTILIVDDQPYFWELTSSRAKMIGFGNTE